MGEAVKSTAGLEAVEVDSGTEGPVIRFGETMGVESSGMIVLMSETWGCSSGGRRRGRGEASTESSSSICLRSNVCLSAAVDPFPHCIISSSPLEKETVEERLISGTSIEFQR
jgi:hypothetical protein